MSAHDPLSLAALVRRFRLTAGLSQEELAERSGLSTRQISDLERGLRKLPRLETIQMLADGLDLSNDRRAELLAAARPELRASHDPSNLFRISQPLRMSLLPVPHSLLIGREHQVDELVSRLRSGSTRLITVTGPGGVGKTRLALEVAHRLAPEFKDGAVFIDLAPISNPEMVASTMAQTLDIRESHGRSTRDTLRAVLSTKNMLLLIDNFEHVIDAASFVSDLHAVAPTLQFLVTSREALRIRGELQVLVEPLSLPLAADRDDFDHFASNPAVSLFVQGAKAVKTSFTLTAKNARDVAEICRRLDGLPLALELAASRIRHFPPDLLLQNLHYRLPVLVGGQRDLPARQQTLRDTIAWSYHLLSPEEQTLFRRVGIFLGGARFAAIEAVVNASGNVDMSLVSGIGSLVDKNLLRETEDSDGAPRFSMLETIREFAIEQLRANREVDVAREAHANHYLAVAERYRRGAHIPRLERLPLQVLDKEIENMRSVVQWCDETHNTPALARLCFRLWFYFYSRRRVREGLSLCQRTLDLAEQHPINDGERGLVLAALSHATALTSDPARGEAIAREGLRLLEHVSSNYEQAPWVLTSLTIALREQRRFADAAAIAEHAYDEAVKRNEEYFIPHALYQRGCLAFLQADLERAARLLEESLELCSNLGAHESSQFATIMLAAVHIRLGEAERAVRLLRDFEALRQNGLYLGETGFWPELIPGFAVARGDDATAARFSGYLESFFRSMGQSQHSDPWLDQLMAGVCDRLGENDFETAFLLGQVMTSDEAREMALDYLNSMEL